MECETLFVKLVTRPLFLEIHMYFRLYGTIVTGANAWFDGKGLGCSTWKQIEFGEHEATSWKVMSLSHSPSKHSVITGPALDNYLW